MLRGRQHMIHFEIACQIRFRFSTRFDNLLQTLPNDTSQSVLLASSHEWQTPCADDISLDGCLGLWKKPLQECRVKSAVY